MSVGNLATGGRGKTPVVEHVARLLAGAGERPAILSRGYGRTEFRPGAVVVSDGEHIRASIAEAGDEPLMLARALPGVRVVVCDDRRAAGALAETHLGATVHVLDDGFQHLVLRRDVDLVIVAPEDLSARAFPFGPLREPARALADADAVLRGSELISTDPGGKGSDPFPPGSAEIRSDPLLGLRESTPGVDSRSRFFDIRRALQVPGAPGRAVAVAGIARPGRFFADLEGLGWSLAERLAFGDHHRYSPADVGRIGDAASRSGAAAIVTTAKDAVRLPEAHRWPVPLAVATLTVSIEPAPAFRGWLLDRLARARS